MVEIFGEFSDTNERAYRTRSFDRNDQRILSLRLVITYLLNVEWNAIACWRDKIKKLIQIHRNFH